jgi:hypothetical protein
MSGKLLCAGAGSKPYAHDGGWETEDGNNHSFGCAVRKRFFGANDGWIGVLGRSKPPSIALHSAPGVPDLNLL